MHVTRPEQRDGDSHDNEFNADEKTTYCCAENAIFQVNPNASIDKILTTCPGQEKKTRYDAILSTSFG